MNHKTVLHTKANARYNTGKTHLGSNLKKLFVKKH